MRKKVYSSHSDAVTTPMTSRWLPISPLKFCLSHTECKIILFDPERASLLEPIISEFVEQIGSTGFLVFDSTDGKGHWNGMTNFDNAIEDYRGETKSVLESNVKILPEDNATIMFTSGAVLNSYSISTAV